MRPKAQRSLDRLITTALHCTAVSQDNRYSDHNLSLSHPEQKTTDAFLLPALLDLLGTIT